jgi:hypothetical protein
MQGEDNQSCKKHHGSYDYLLYFRLVRAFLILC